jgi:transformation/transcription domain-associated protein
MCKDLPSDLTDAAHAVSRYLQAPGLYKNGKRRPLLARILWLLNLDDNASTISRAFDTCKGDDQRLTIRPTAMSMFIALPL